VLSTWATVLGLVSEVIFMMENAHPFGARHGVKRHGRTF
jgi:hypothetical protein